MGTIERTGATWESVYSLAEADLDERTERRGEIRKYYAGLTDIDLNLGIVEDRLKLAVSGYTSHPDERERVLNHVAVALTELRAVVGTGLSEDQRPVLMEHPSMVAVRGLLERAWETFGEDFFAAAEEEIPDLARVRRVVLKALAKLSGRNPGGVDVEKGEEEEMQSQKMALPLSQAILMIEDEFIPRLERDLAEDPGNILIQERLDELRVQADLYKNTTFFPRSRPVNFEKDIFTTALHGYASNGEIMVTVSLPTYIKGLNREDRIRDEFKAEVVKNLAGAGVFEELDEAFKESVDPASGRDGSTFEAGGRLDVPGWYANLGRKLPLLRALDDSENFSRILPLAEAGGREALEKGLSTLSLETDRMIAALTGDNLDDHEG